ncbi:MULTISPECIES: hypothetical protein [Haloarcula]|uniref:Uncharacterized protein n=3 Tax=Haloarcula TaxID=2237 RepID=A0A830EVK9_9EURY|nr:MULTISPECIES: hypothetical protein [Haloarcula]EMA31345.1 hypothetical protein C444_08285 [Haloarcula japonica DSM 6131]GGK78917.1 hypothetical protein GCM10009067_34020 [Haloarcula sebkhae]
MSLIDSLLDDTTSAEPEDSSEPTIKLSESENEVVYPVVVEASELSAYKRLFEYDIETPYGVPETPEFLEDVLNEPWREATLGDRSWQEETNQTRDAAKAIIGAWSTELSGERGVILMPTGAYYYLAKPLWACGVRVKQNKAPPKIIDDLLTAASLVKRLKSAETGDVPAVFAHVGDVPMTSGEMDSC